MNFKKIVLLIILILIFIPIRVHANDDGTTNINLSDLDSFSKRLQQDVDYMPEISFSKMLNTYKTTHSLGFTLKDLTNSFGKFVFKEITANSRLLVELLFIGMLCAILQNMQNAFASDSVSKIAYYACFLVMVIIIIKSFMLAIQVGRDTIDNIIQFTNALMPPLLVLLAAVGGFASAAALDPIIMIVIKVTSDIIRDIVLPMSILVVLLNIVDNLSDEIKITKLAGLIKQVNTWILGFIVTVFVGVVTVRSSTSATLDQVAQKTGKFMLDNFIPVIGKTLSDALTTVASYSLVLKDAISVAGLLMMIFICVFPLIKIILISLIYKFVGAVMEPVVDKKIVNCLTTVGNSLTIVFASVLAVAIMFFILITIIISTGRLVTMVG